MSFLYHGIALAFFYYNVNVKVFAFKMKTGRYYVLFQDADGVNEIVFTRLLSFYIRTVSLCENSDKKKYVGTIAQRACPCNVNAQLSCEREKNGEKITDDELSRIDKKKNKKKKKRNAGALRGGIFTALFDECAR